MQYNAQIVTNCTTNCTQWYHGIFGHPSESTWRCLTRCSVPETVPETVVLGSKQPCIAWQAMKSLESRYRQVDPDVGDYQGRSQRHSILKDEEANKPQWKKASKHLAPILTLQKHLLQFTALPWQTFSKCAKSPLWGESTSFQKICAVACRMPPCRWVSWAPRPRQICVSSLQAEN